MDIEATERELRALRERESALYVELRRKHSPEELAAKRKLLGALSADGLRLERVLAAARGEPHAVEWPLPEDWTLYIERDPLVIANGLHTLLVFEAVRGKPERRMGVLKFELCESSRLGSPNDEVISGHPLFGKGIEVGESYVVENSPWLEELRAINKVHSNYDPEFWRPLKHYLFFFKELTFECLARRVSSQVLEGSMREASAHALHTLFDR